MKQVKILAYSIHGCESPQIQLIINHRFPRRAATEPNAFVRDEHFSFNYKRELDANRKWRGAPTAALNKLWDDLPLRTMLFLEV